MSGLPGVDWYESTNCFSWRFASGSVLSHATDSVMGSKHAVQKVGSHRLQPIKFWGPIAPFLAHAKNRLWSQKLTELEHAKNPACVPRSNSLVFKESCKRNKDYTVMRSIHSKASLKYVAIIIIGYKMSHFFVTNKQGGGAEDREESAVHSALSHDGVPLLP